MNEDTKYENIIAGYTNEQLLIEEAILDEKETVLYNQKKALKEERKKRLNNQMKGK